jgi:hypothetical protein
MICQNHLSKSMLIDKSSYTIRLDMIDVHTTMLPTTSSAGESYPPCFDLSPSANFSNYSHLVTGNDKIARGDA